MTDQQLLDMYINIAEFISLCFSGDVEVVVHDLSHLDSSAVALFNNHVSGRDKGAPMTDMGLLFISDERFKEKKWVTNYQGVTDQGVIVKSSTFFIRNMSGKLIGSLCVNVDVRKYEALKKLVESMLPASQAEKPNGSPERLQAAPVSPLMREIASRCSASGRGVDDFGMADRLHIIATLDGQQFFERKGAISETADGLKISEPSVYRYLHLVRKEKNGKKK